MAKIPKTKITIPVIVAVSIFAITLISFSPIDVSAEYGQFQIPEISGTIAIAEDSDDYFDKAAIALSVAMAVSENSVENGKAMWGEVKDTFFALSLDERAKMIMHFMSMKVQLESLSDEEKDAKRFEMKLMM